MCPNTSALLEAHYAVPAAGGTLVALNSRLGSQEIDFILKHSGARFLFVDNELSPLVEPLTLDGIQVIRIDDTGASADPYEVFLTQGLPGPVVSWLEDEEEPISINYTSGTTGLPKGGVYTYRGAYLNALAHVIELGLNANSVYLWTLPMFHCNGWCFTWAVTAVGGTHVCPFLLGTFTDLLRERSELIVENALLRQQLIILHRQIKRPVYWKKDRLLLVLLARMVRTWKQALFLVQPETLLRLPP